VVAGHGVWVEAGAGAGIGISDAAYAEAGATMVPTAADVFATAEMIVKVKEPQAREWAMLRIGQILFTCLHVAPDAKQTQGLLRSGATAIAYETVVDAEGGLPLVAPMSEVAGRLSIEAAATALKRTNGGSGKLLGGVPGVAPARVLILGGGGVGTHAARMAVGLGADVTIVDRSLPRLRALDELFGGRVRTRSSSIAAIEDELARADAVIDAVLVAGAAAPRLVSRRMLALMQPRSVLVDVAIDQGGCFETSRPTTRVALTYEVDGIIHYLVANMPGAVPRTATEALTNATLPYVLALARDGLGAMRRDVGLLQGLNIHRGKCTNQPVADVQGLAYLAPAAALDLA
jgi:alanine dehydrogenase